MFYFFHGFESSLPSGKVDIMNNLGFNTIGIPMNYNSHSPFKDIELLVIKNKPRLIVGSSMGGYFALHIGSRHNIPLILLNPALCNRPTSLDAPIEFGEYRPKIWALLGKFDDVIPAKGNEQELEKYCASIKIWNHGHRTPNDVFQKYLAEIEKEIREHIWTH